IVRLKRTLHRGILGAAGRADAGGLPRGRTSNGSQGASRLSIPEGSPVCYAPRSGHQRESCGWGSSQSFPHLWKKLWKTADFAAVSRRREASALVFGDGERVYGHISRASVVTFG